MKGLFLMALIGASLAVDRVQAQSFSFSTGDPDGRLGAGSRPSSTGKIEIESADDFILTAPISLTSATFTGLLPANAPLSDVVGVTIEIYRVFPFDSDVSRTSGSPTFGTPQVPTRVNSPSDVAFTTRDSSLGGGLTFTAAVVSSSFTVANSILNGINPLPNVLTGGEGPVTGEEVTFLTDFSTPLNLPADHYFFVPQVELANGDFFWLSAPRPIVPPGTPFIPDLQAWIRNENLAPDWLREGTDIVGGTTFNQAFSLTGVSTPENGSTAAFLGMALTALVLLKRRDQTRSRVC